MTIADKLLYLSDTKQSIRDALTVVRGDPGAVFRDYSTEILRAAPTLLLDFVNDRYIIPSSDPLAGNAVDFSRPSEKSGYYTPDGVLGTASNNEWPLEYDPVTHEPLGRSVWEARTNLVPNSSDLSTAGGWTSSSLEAGYTLSNGVGASREPTANMIKRAGVYDSSNLSWIIDATYTAWNLDPTGRQIMTFTTPAGCDRVRIYVNRNADNNNGAYRTIDGLTPGQTYTASFYAEDREGHTYIGGVQLEAGSSPSPYIPTSGSAVTRAADVVSITGDDFSSWFNPPKGAFAVRFVVPSHDACVLCLSDGTTDNLMELVVESGAVKWRIVKGGVEQAVLNGGAVTPGSVCIAAPAYAEDDFALSVNGDAAVTASSGKVPVVDRMYIGSRNGLSAWLNNYIRRIVYYPKRMSNVLLQALSGGSL